MRHIQQIIFALTATATLAFTGCQQVVKPVVTTPTLEPTDGSTQKPSNQFNLEGKIGVKTPKQSGSAFYTWAQNDHDFNIQLNGILGLGKTIIEGKSGEVTLNSAKTGLISAESPEQLLEKATGWVAPITHIVDWVQGYPATENAQVARDSTQRISQIVEDGWTVDFNYNNQATLPNKLILKQQLESGQENRITMVIQNR
ncbi:MULTISPECIES: lipoprotein insertase outer membrane protein LolB [unclassified Acinetobacter]|uniref:lipoprotein insertase outer membrane protein LolB n=1 Tax=Acinetobacter TaxID=469 RepID=UPI0018AA7CE7|nr:MULTISPECIES: lipoprotein insertase outer membrane protein LolB [unclassified Acinetobacter]MBJ9952786.1 outer membrane lipoprotein LolB [Acinetobacter baumannii]